MVVTNDLTASQTSNSSVVQLPSQYESLAKNSLTDCYHFNVRLDSYENLASILTIESSFWFSWTILDLTIQTAVYDINYPEAADEYLTIQCSAPALAKFLKDLSSLRIYLCVPNKIISYLEIHFPKDLTLPLQFSGWYPVAPPEISSPSKASAVEGSMLVHVTLNVQKVSTEQQKFGSKMNQSIQVNTNPEAHVDGHDENSIDGSQDYEQDPDHDHQSHREVEEDEDDLKDDSEYDTKKYRLSFQIRSIRGLKRAAHISLQFAYPHLGVSSSPIRTHGTWCLAHSDTLIEGATASYEFQMISSQLLTTLQQNKLIVNVISRTHLGTDRIGDASVDLNQLLVPLPKPQSNVKLLYRCPLTSKQFKSLEQYHRHRKTMMALYTLGRVNEVPSRVPIAIHSIDHFASILGKLSTNGVPEVVGKLRCLLVLEELGSVTGATAAAVTESLKASDPLFGDENHLFDSRHLTQTHQNHLLPPPPPPPPPTPEENDVLRRLEWEEWRRQEEEKWMKTLREKEIQLRQRLEQEMITSLSQKADDLRRGQEEVSRLEVRLRTSLEAVEKQRAQLEMKEEQMTFRLKQKTDELNLLSKRIRDDQKMKIEIEKQKVIGLENEVSSLRELVQRSEKRCMEVEKDYETYRQYIRSIPETKLREEVMKGKVFINELKKEIEIEKRLRSEMELEKEHYRSQLQRVAMGLKREREKNNVIARQDLEQLRLEFLAREERYVLDGDRDELRTIREELAYLRMGKGTGTGAGEGEGEGRVAPGGVGRKSSVHLAGATGSSRHTPPPPPVPPVPQVAFKPSSEPSSSSLISFHTLVGTDHLHIDRLKQMRNELLQSQLYDPSDEVILEIDEAIYQQQRAATQKLEGALEQK